MSRMLEPAEAIQIIDASADPLPPHRLPLEKVLGLRLGEDVVLDRDMPPFRRAAMDGYAVRSADVPEAGAILPVSEEIPAGREPSGPLPPGAAARIMTGAPAPDGADAVVPIEEAESVAGGVRVRIPARPRPGRNIAPAGSDRKAGTRLLDAGHVIRPGEIGILAAAGAASPRVHRAPLLAVLATGDELVDHDQTPTGARIRNSNGPMISALSHRAGAWVRPLGIGRDRRADLDTKVAEGLRGDVLVLSGGVSAGAYDLVEGSLKDQGVEILFERVNLKPGRPTVFGRKGATLVFGLPGNPVSSFVTFELFVRPALRKLAGFGFEERPRAEAVLEAPLRSRNQRWQFLPARARREGARIVAAPVEWAGSADLFSLAGADALLVVEPGAGPFETGASRPVILEVGS